MSLRKVLLKGMLWSLGFAALAGVLTVLTSGGEWAWRIVGTGFTTAAACGLVLSMLPLIDREKTRSAGLLGMTTVLLEFLMGLILIWQLPRLLLGFGWEDEIALTMVSLAAGAAATSAMMKLRVESYGRLAGSVGMIVTLAVFLLVMFVVWGPDRYVVEDDLLLTAGALCSCGGLAVLALVGHGTGDRRHWRWAGVTASAIGCAMWLAEIWVGVGSDPGFVVFCMLLSLAAVVGHANLSLMCPLTEHQRWVRTGAIATAILAAAFVNLIVIDDRLLSVGLDEDVLNRIAGAAGIVACCGTLAMCVFVGINRKVDYERLSPELTHMVVICPRCGKKQPVRLGDSACAVCKLRITVRIEEPRCPQCDYLLYGLTSNRCPECGTSIGQVDSPAPTQ